VTVIQMPTTVTSVVYRATPDGRRDLLVIGPRTRGRYHEPKNMPVCIRVGLPAGAASRLSPKQFARISRVRRVLARAGQERWASLAEEAGFFDQAHMIGDFRSLMGVTPAAFLAGKRPAVTPCQGRN
jgi:hypothetical protein